jgi:hypothetical protein
MVTILFLLVNIALMLPLYYNMPKLLSSFKFSYVRCPIGKIFPRFGLNQGCHPFFLTYHIQSRKPTRGGATRVNKIWGGEVERDRKEGYRLHFRICLFITIFI